MKYDQVIGLGYLVIHDSNVAIVSSQDILFACSEERLSRRKKDGKFPLNTLKFAKTLTSNSSPIICSYYDTPKYLKVHEKTADSGRINVNRNIQDTKQLRETGVSEFLGHHYSHAAGGYYTSGFGEAIVVTYDAGILCEPWLATIWEGREGKLIPIEKITRLDGAVAAIRYSGVTSLLGYRTVFDEGKITGLAAYGSVREDCIQELNKAFAKSNEPHCYWDGSFAKEFSYIRNFFSDSDIAASIQYLTELSVIELLLKTVSNIPEKNCVLSGGLFANVKLNQKIKELGFKNLYIYPAMGDEGLGLGAALGFLARFQKVNHRLEHVYLGPSYPSDIIKESLEESGLKYEECSKINQTVAELLAQGHVVARFNGAMEFGPRALGNRSILYQTTDTSVNNWLNKRLRRTEFMPFAPVTLQEHSNAMYIGLEGLEDCTKFMTISVNCTEQMRKLSPGAVHIDGTARPQILDKTTNPSFYEILHHYYKLTGIPSLINTSFNMHSEPIVCSSEDAIRSFLNGHLDYLAIDDFLVKNPALSLRTKPI